MISSLGFSERAKRGRTLLVLGWPVLCAAALLCLPGAGLPRTSHGFPVLQRFAASHGAAVSALAVDLRTHRVLWRLHPTRALTPASLSKLYVTASALRRWGPDKRFTTRLLADGRLRQGTLDGDLVLLGGGAPALSGKQLWQLARRARAAGLRRVTGDLVVNGSKFGPVACTGKDRCRAETLSRHAYASPPSAAGVNFNTWCVAVRPGARKGAAARVAACKAVSGAPPIQGRITTAPAGHPSRFSVTRILTSGGDALRVKGFIAADASMYRIHRTVADPGYHTAVLLRQALREQGITIAGKARTSYLSPPVDNAIAEVHGQTLRALLGRMLAYSNNYMADVLTLDLAANAGVEPPLELAGAAGLLLHPNAKAAHLPKLMAADAPPELFSGSGLSVTSRISAANLVGLLADMYRRPALFPAFLGALTVPIFSPFNILNHARGLWSTDTAIKTGSLHQPVTVLGVAGYARLNNGDWGALAMVINGTRHHPHFNIRETMSVIQGDINCLLGGTR